LWESFISSIRQQQPPSERASGKSLLPRNYIHFDDLFLVTSVSILCGWLNKMATFINFVTAPLLFQIFFCYFIHPQISMFSPLCGVISTFVSIFDAKII
jgi:hypothetical protein